MTIDLTSIGRELKKPIENIETAIKLLDEGNTIPFITRFRKDQTGGLTEEQLLTIKSSVARLRALAERKSFISKSIDSQGKLTEKIQKQIDISNSTRELEDVYLPFKPKKQTLATIARQNGLEPLANDIFEGLEPEKDLATRSTDFVRVDKDLNSVDEVIAGVKHILAERFSDNISLRNDLRTIINKGNLTTKLIAIQEHVSAEEGTPAESQQEEKDVSAGPVGDDSNDKPDSQDEMESVDSGVSESPPADSEPISDSTESAEASTAAPEEAGEPNTNSVGDDQGQSDSQGSIESPAQSGNEPTETEPAVESQDLSKTEASEKVASEKLAKPGGSKKKKKKKKAEDPYKEFNDFSHPVSKMAYYKTLAINRGEKNGRLKVKIQFGEDEILSLANKKLVSDEHPFKEFLHECVKDGMYRLVIPSLERETRREITEAAEKHAVQVFARNLKNLLLQSPVRNQKVLSIDPGYKRGCSVAVLDSRGQLLDNAHIFVVGNEKRRLESREKLAELINSHEVSLIAIGNGTACREAEQMVSDLISEHFSDGKLKYAMVNEAGASFYSTSEVGREEFPDLSPAVRSAISIGRRLIDPLSELVKISPANIGVGLYQHDVKAKHLAESLDDVVQFCVNRVGVDANTASTSLLKYVSGLNQLTARRVFEYRKENGPFRNREQLKNVSGFGDATFVQSAGFLRIHSGDQPLDSTAIHPEQYPTAEKIFEKAGAAVEQLFPVPLAQVSETHVVEAEISDTEPTTATGEPADPTSEIADEADLVATTANELVDSNSEVEPSNESEPDKTDEIERTESTKVEAAPVHKLTDEQLSKRKELVKTIRNLEVAGLAKEFGIGQMLVQDIIHSICRPEYDPRNNVNRPVFRSGIIKLDDLSVDMQLEAQVVNVVDFGVFVDIGLGSSCLVHVSQLANHFIRDPHRFYAVGDSLRVWVTEVDIEKRRVKLTAVQPKSLRPKRKTDRKPNKSFGKPRPRRGNRQGGNTQFKRKGKAKPKPVKPITEDMLKGAEPMRSFSDLAQFFDKQDDDKDGNKS